MAYVEKDEVRVSADEASQELSNQTTRSTPLISSLLRIWWEQAGMLVVFFAVFVGCALFVENFFSRVNMISLMLAISTLGMVACTMLFCLASGDFDLSIGSVVAFSGVLAAVVINRTGNVALGITCAIAAAGAVGLFNGIVIAKFGINALIATLATMQIARGLAFIISGGRAVGVSQESFFLLGNSSLWGIPTPVWITLACFVLFGFLLRQTTFGRNTLAIGGNREAAHLAGIAVDRTKIIIFTTQGLMAGLAGIVLASRMTSGQPNVSEGFELQVISACVLGGISLTGGVGNIGCVIAGVLIMGTVQNAMNLMSVPTFYQRIVTGVILLSAVLFDRLRQHQSRA